MASGTLHVCAVPIGNLSDASPHLRSVLGAVDVIACEDTRTTRKLLDLLDVTPVPRLLAHHDHNERASAIGIVKLLEQGQDVALVSDAGTPAISDPGSEVVAGAHAAGIRVTAVAGPSAVAAAVSVSGAHEPGAGYRFCGFLPRAQAPLEQLVTSRADELLVAYESPHRVRQSLAWIADCQPLRTVTVCRELTKLHEQVARGTAGELLDVLDEHVRGELVLVLDPMSVKGDEGGAPDAAIVAFVLTLSEAGVGLKRAARLVADHHGVGTRELYEAAILARDPRN